MSELEKIAKQAYPPLIGINSITRIIDACWNGKAATDVPVMFKDVPSTIIDKETLALIQVVDLHAAMDHAATAVGSATLFRSLMRPLTSLDLILAKQESVRELESNDKLRNAIGEYLKEFQKGENDLFKFLNGCIGPIGVYRESKAATKAGKRMADAVKNIPMPESPYARFLIDEIRNFEGSPAYRLMRGPIWRTFRGLKSKEDVGYFTPRLKFRYHRFTLDTYGFLLPIAGAVGGMKMGMISGEVASAISFGLSVFGAYWALLYGGIAKPRIDLDKVIDPLRKKTLRDLPFIGAIDAVGKLDELMSFIAYAKATPHPTALPQITRDTPHYFLAKDMTNTIQSKNNPSYVPNDVNLVDAKLTLITGPNSGGKTTFCKTVVQEQLKGQIGCYVNASRAKMAIADRVYYQAPRFDSLQDEEGRFGTELKRTREIFYSTTPQSLVILDELAEGTTLEEKMQHSKTVLNGFYDIGNNTLLVTHNHQLVDYFNGEGKGQCLQVQFDGDAPTHKVVQGISRVSHADRVAKKIGFSAEDIDAHLIKQGHRK